VKLGREPFLYVSQARHLILCAHLSFLRDETTFTAHVLPFLARAKVVSSASVGDHASGLSAKSHGNCVSSRGCEALGMTPGELAQPAFPLARVSRRLALLFGTVILFALLAQAQPDSVVSYKVQLDFGQRLVGFDTCDEPPWDIIVIERAFQLKRSPMNATLYLHLYSIDRCAAYFSVYVNGFILAEKVRVKELSKAPSEGEPWDVYLPLSIPTTYLRDSENTVRIVLLRECGWVIYSIWWCGARCFYLYNDSYVELVYRAVKVLFDCKPRVCGEVDATVSDPLGLVQNIRLTRIPGAISVAEGASVNFTVRDKIEAGLTRWLFRGYEKAESESTMSVVAVYDTYHYVSVSTPVSRASGGGWYEANSTVTVAVADTVVELPNGTRLVFAGWRGSLNSSSPSVQLKVDSPKVLTALWVREYYVSASPPLSGCSGWYREGSPLGCEIPEVIRYGNGSRDVLREVYLNSKAAGRKPQVAVRGPLEVRAEYVRQYLVGVSALAYVGPLAIPTEIPLAGGGWYDAGSAASVKAPREARLLLLPLVFEKWEGDLESSREAVSFAVDSPKRLVAVARARYARWLPALLKKLKSLVIDIKLRSLEKKEGKIPSKELREEAASKQVGEIMEPMVENVVRNIENFCNWLEGRGEASGLEVLAQLKKQVEGPLTSLERYFKGVKRYEEIVRGVDVWVAKLEVKGRGKMSGEEVRALAGDAHLWAVDCRNLHYV